MKKFRDLMNVLFGGRDGEPSTDAPAPSPIGQVAPNGVTARRVVTLQDFSVVLDLEPQVLRIEAPDDHGYAGGDDEDSQASEAPLFATLPETDPQGPLAAAVLAQKAKVFEDGLLAAVEIAAQRGIGAHGGKRNLLATLGRVLATATRDDSKSAREVILGAARLGGIDCGDMVPAVVADVERIVSAFLADERASKPLGFYTWTKDLGDVFRQDRLLQRPLDGAAAVGLARLLSDDATSRANYERHLRLVERLTNPFSSPDLRPILSALEQGGDVPPAMGAAFVPPSVAPETTLVTRLFGNRPIPDDFVLADEMVGRIRARQLDLTPSSASGWYDHVLWSLEALIALDRLPEGRKLRLDTAYEEMLSALFKGLLTLTRESHVKQLVIPMCGAAFPGGDAIPPIDIAPELSAEPLPTHYLRRGLAYRYVKTVLEETFGADALQQLHRLTPEGESKASLAAELDAIESLFLGAHVQVCRELGLSPDPAAGSEENRSCAAASFLAWRGDLASDPDLARDVRTMVPVFHDIERKQTKVWAFLGWSSRPIDVHFDTPPGAHFVRSNGERLTRAPSIEWRTLHGRLPYPVTAEVYVDRLLDRDEFRLLCDECRTRGEILRRLSAAR